MLALPYQALPKYSTVLQCTTIKGNKKLHRFAAGLFWTLARGQNSAQASWDIIR